MINKKKLILIQIFKIEKIPKKKVLHTIIILILRKLIKQHKQNKFNLKINLNNNKIFIKNLN